MASLRILRKSELAVAVRGRIALLLSSTLIVLAGNYSSRAEEPVAIDGPGSARTGNPAISKPGLKLPSTPHVANPAMSVPGGPGTNLSGVNSQKTITPAPVSNVIRPITPPSSGLKGGAAITGTGLKQPGTGEATIGGLAKPGVGGVTGTGLRHR